MGKSKRPRVIANFAMTLDGKVSTRNWTPSDFTSEKDKERLREIRALGDALIVGRKTVAADRMSMTLRDEKLRQQRVNSGKRAEPLRMIVSKSGQFDPQWKVFQTPGERIILFCEESVAGVVRLQFGERDDVDVIGIKKINASKILQIIRSDYGVEDLVCEGGPGLFRSFLEIGAVDLLHLTISPVVFGGELAPTLTGISMEFLPKRIRFRLVEMEMEKNGEIYLQYERC